MIDFQWLAPSKASPPRPSAGKNGFPGIPKGGYPCEMVAEAGTGDFLRLRDIDKLWQGNGFDASVTGTTRA